MSTPDASKRPALPLSTPPDPVVVKRHLAEIRDAEHALAQSKYWLASYLSTHAKAHCEYGTEAHRAKPSDRSLAPDGRKHFDCNLEVDGVVLLSCGHYVYACATGGSRILHEIAMSREVVCTRTDAIHAEPIYGIRGEWQGLA